MKTIPEVMFFLLPIQIQHYVSPSQKMDWGNATFFFEWVILRDKVALPVLEIQ